MAIRWNQAFAFTELDKGGISARLVPILPDYGLFVQALDGCDPRRFVERFKGTWAMIPSEDQRSLTDYWEAVADGTIEIRPADGAPPDLIIPGIYLGTKPLGNGGRAFPLAQSGAGFRLWFAAAAIELLPAEHCETLIAHELMHACLDIEGRTETQEDRDCIEELVRWAVSEQWGFDHPALDNWHHLNPGVIPDQWTAHWGKKPSR